MNSPDFDPADLHAHDNASNDGADTPTSQSRKRKAPGASASAGGRGVASLTPEQLAKKRANDREAQRAIRERTRNEIDTLKRRINELTSQQPYQELQSIIRQKEAVQAENEEIRRRLGSVVNILQPVLGASSAQGLSELAQAAQQNVQQNAIFQPPEHFMAPAPMPPRSVPPPATLSDSPTYPSPFASSDHESSGEGQPWTNQRTALNHQRESIQRNHELSENGDRLNFGFLLDSTSGSIPSIPGRNSPSDRHSHTTFNGSPGPAHPWTMLPKNCSPTCPLDNILINFLQARQQETKNPTSTPTYTSPAYPSISNLLNPTNTTTSAGTFSPSLSRHIPSRGIPSNHASPTTPTSRSDPISTLMTDIISKFPNISSLPEQVATTYTMFLLMRWQIFPTQENYDRLPEWLTPRPSQLFTPHPAWIEHLPWPRMRDKVVRDWESYMFQDWFLPFTSGMSVNWPYEPVDCLIVTSDEADPVINPVFERHIRRLENWSVGPQFVATFPVLADTCTVRDKAGHGGIGLNVPLDNNQIPHGLSGLGTMGVQMPNVGGQQRQNQGQANSNNVAG